MEQGKNLVESSEDEGVEVTSKTTLPLPSKVAIPATNERTNREGSQKCSSLSIPLPWTGVSAGFEAKHRRRGRRVLPEDDAVGDLEALPVLVGVEVGAHQQRVRRAERQRQREHPSLRSQRPRPRQIRILLPRRRGLCGGRAAGAFRRRRVAGVRSPAVAHLQRRSQPLPRLSSTRLAMGSGRTTGGGAAVAVAASPESRRRRRRNSLSPSPESRRRAYVLPMVWAFWAGEIYSPAHFNCIFVLQKKRRLNSKSMGLLITS